MTAVQGLAKIKQKLMAVTPVWDPWNKVKYKGSLCVLGNGVQLYDHWQHSVSQHTTYCLITEDRQSWRRVWSWNNSVCAYQHILFFTGEALKLQQVLTRYFFLLKLTSLPYSLLYKKTSSLRSYCCLIARRLARQVQQQWLPRVLWQRARFVIHSIMGKFV